MVIEGFRLLDEELGLPSYAGALADISEVTFGFHPHRQLRLLVAIGGQSGQIVFDDPVSHRVSDERELIHYWNARSTEAAAPGHAYEISRSPYLSEMSAGASAAFDKLIHYLFVGADLCVEVVAAEAPEITLS